MPNSIAISEKEKLAIIKACDEAVAAHSKSSLELGKAFLAVRDSGAYLLTHPTIESFMQDKYDLERSRVYQLIAGVETINKIEANVHHGGQTQPNLTSKITNERQARALSDIPEELQIKVLESLAENNAPVTAKSIKTAAAVISGNEKQKPKSKPKANESLLPHVQEAFDHRYEFDAIINDLCVAVDKAKHLKAKKIGEFVAVERFASIVENAKVQIAFAKPWADCVPCQQKGCKLCHKQGWLPRDFFKTLTLDLQALSVVRGKKGTE